MKLRNLLLAACFVTIVTQEAPAQPGGTCAAPSSDPLLQQWVENEGDWNGIWEPVSAPVARTDGSRLATYRAQWSKPTGFGHFSSSHEDAAGTLKISINGNAIEIDRMNTPNMRDTCHYRGTLVTPDRARGSYTCSYHPIALRWQARINTPTSMYCNGNDPRLNTAWHEQEGDWRSEWTPTGTPGQFTAAYRKGRETDNATMNVQIVEDGFHSREIVRVRRTEPRGHCDYDGFLIGPTGAVSPDGWRVNGRYECSWGGGNLPWGATIGDGHP